MQITVISASSKTGLAAVRALLASPSSPVVVGVYRNTAKAPADLLSLPNFRAVQGDLEDGASLDFTGSDAVITLTPSVREDRDPFELARTASNSVRDAARRSGVRRVVLVSSAGAQFETRTGEIATNHVAETILADAAPEVAIVRGGYFMENWATALQTVLLKENPFFFSTITPLDYKVPMVATEDIGAVTAAEALKVGTTLPPHIGSGTGPHTIDLQGPQSYSPLDVQAAFEAVLGKKIELRPVPPSELHAFFSQTFPERLVSPWVEMSTCYLPGGPYAEVLRKFAEEAVRGKIELMDVVRKLCAESQRVWLGM